MRTSMLLLLAGLATTVACDEAGPTVTDAVRDGDGVTFVATLDPHGGLRQEIRLSHAEPRRGDTLRITSSITSSGRDVVTARICGLDLRGELELRDPFVRCAGYSMHGSVVAGTDSIVGDDGGIVVSAAGQYELQVRHLLEPEIWVRVPVTVRP